MAPVDRSTGWRRSPAPREAHVRPRAGQLSLREWEFLRDVFEFEIRALERTLQRDCAEWLRPPADLASQT